MMSICIQTLNRITGAKRSRSPGVPAKPLWIGAGLALLLYFAWMPDGQSQTNPPAYALDSVMVEATKFPFSPYDMASSLTVLTRDQFSEFAGSSLTDILATIHGLQTYDFSATGTNTIIDIRGFASSGETSYLRLLIDGVPVNELNSDNVDWNLIDLDQIERIEILRGPTSALHGNIGMSGLINVVTRRPAPGVASSVSVIGGDQDQRGLKALLHFGSDRMQMSLAAKSRKIAGWRDHSDWRARQFHANLKTSLGSIDERRVTLSVSALYLDFDRDDPGAIPLTAPTWSAETAIDRESSKKWQVASSLAIPLRDDMDLQLMASTQGKDAEVVKTIFYQPKNRDIASDTYRLEARFRHRLTFGRWGANLMLGFERESGRLDNAYYEVVPGTGTRAFLATRGKTRRTASSSYAQLHMDLTRRLSVIGGMRYDEISDRYASRITPDRQNTDMKAMSSSVALNWRWASASNIYGSVSRSFKAPTLEQLHDQRPFYIAYDLPPIRISNGTLEPQHALNYEIGMRTHHGDGVSSELSLYTLQVENEIGFDLANFRYANIMESRHWGIEASISFRLHEKLRLRQGYTLMDATFSGGEHDGNQINGVPKHMLVSRLAYHWSKNLTASAEMHHIRDQFIDEGNQFPLEAFTVFNAGIGYAFARLHLDLSVRNLLNRNHFASGYLTQGQDQAGNMVPLPLVFPGRQRSVAATLSVRL